MRHRHCGYLITETAPNSRSFSEECSLTFICFKCIWRDVCSSWRGVGGGRLCCDRMICKGSDSHRNQGLMMGNIHAGRNGVCLHVNGHTHTSLTSPYLPNDQTQAAAELFVTSAPLFGVVTSKNSKTRRLLCSRLTSFHLNQRRGAKRPSAGGASPG